MSDLVPSDHKTSMQTIDVIVAKTTPDEKRQLLDLINTLLDIRGKDTSWQTKVQETLALFKQSKAALPLFKYIKTIIWDNRSIAWKIGIGAVLGTAVLMPGNAGIAAFGGAIGVPLWVVIGGGYSFAVLLADKLKKSLSNGERADIIDATYTVVDEKQK